MQGSTEYEVKMYGHEDTIYRILEYIKLKDDEWKHQLEDLHPVQEPWSRWAIDEIIGELKLNEYNYSNEVIRGFIHNMDKYAEVAEPERKALYLTAKTTAEDLYLYLFGKEN